jgi:hypothetical protein
MSSVCFFLRIVGSSHLKMSAMRQCEYRFLCFAIQISFIDLTEQMLEEAHNKAVRKKIRVYAWSWFLLQENP